MRDWPVVVTNRCAIACAEALGFAGQEAARHWLESEALRSGTTTQELPTPVKGLRSPSGWFFVVDGLIVLPLAPDRTGKRQWIATNCRAFPGVSQQRQSDVDPFTLTGPDLLRHVNLTVHAVERYQERCQGHEAPSRAAEQLLADLGTDARAVPRPPAWCPTKPADFFIVARDEFCLPMIRNGSANKPFDAVTCMHRAQDLLATTGQALKRHCLPDPVAFPPSSRALARLEAGFTPHTWLSFRRPSWVENNGPERFWIILSDRLAAPVRWAPDRPDEPPLRVLGLAERLNPLQRLFRGIRRQR